jgi:hypothetical protein
MGATSKLVGCSSLATGREAHGVTVLDTLVFSGILLLASLEYRLCRLILAELMDAGGLRVGDPFVLAAAIQDAPTNPTNSAIQTAAAIPNPFAVLLSRTAVVILSKAFFFFFFVVFSLSSYVP